MPDVSRTNMFDEERKKKKQEILECEHGKGFTVRDLMALKDLMDLLDENEDHLGGSAEEGPPACPGVSPRAVPPKEIPKFCKKKKKINQFLSYKN